MKSTDKKRGATKPANTRSARNEDDFFAEERRQLIVEFVNKNKRTTVTQLCEKFSVSPATVRNDLRELEHAGLVKRTHGGAMSNSKANYEPDSYQKEVEFVEEKRRIANAAVKLIHESDTIALDTGTTTFELAKLLVSFSNLTVVTNDIQIAYYLERNGKVNIIFAGGVVRRNFHCTTGQKAVDSIADLNVDKSFIAANGIDLKKGVTTPNPDIAQFKRQLMKIANQVVLMTDGSKFGRVSFVKFADVDQIDIIVTDDQAPREMVDLIRKENIDIEMT